MRNPLARLAAIAALSLSALACGSSSGPDFVWFRTIHAMSDSPLLRVQYENYVYLRDVPFGAASDEGGDSLLSSAGRVGQLRASYFQSGGTIGGTLLEVDVPLEKDHTSTVIFAGQFHDPQALTIVAPRLERPLGAMYFQFAHAALELGSLDVYVTAPDTDLASTGPVATLQPRGHTGILQVPFGELRIRLTQAGTHDLILDTGVRTFPELAGPTGPGMQWLFAIAPSVEAGPSPVFLIGSTGRQSFHFGDEGTPATVRGFNALPEIPAVDVLLLDEEEVVLHESLGYRQRSPLVAAPRGKAKFGFRESNEEGEGGEPLATSVTTELGAGQEFAVFLVGPPGDPGVRLNSSPTRSIASEAQLRFAHLSPEGKFFSIYLTGSEGEERGTANRLLGDLRFGTVTDHIFRRPGQYFLTVTERFYENPEDADDALESVLIGPLPVELAGGDVLTWVFFPPENEGEAEGLEVFDDRMP